MTWTYQILSGYPIETEFSLQTKHEVWQGAARTSVCKPPTAKVREKNTFGLEMCRYIPRVLGGITAVEGVRLGLVDVVPPISQGKSSSQSAPASPPRHRASRPSPHSGVHGRWLKKLPCAQHCDILFSTRKLRFRTHVPRLDTRQVKCVLHSRKSDQGPWSRQDAANIWGARSFKPQHCRN